MDKILLDETQENMLSFFELLTMISFNYFAKENVDYAIIEVGLGGTNDATNIIEKPVLSVITNISLDHTAILGETIKKITMEKAGIIKPNVPCVIGPNVDQQIIRDKMPNQCHRLYIADKPQYVEKCTFDEENRLIVNKCIDVVSTYHGKINNLNHIDTNKLLSIKPKCRFEIVKYKSVECIMDCAHNLRGIQELFKSLSNKYDINTYDYRIIIGMSQTKDIDSCLKVVNKYCKYIHFVSISNINKRSLTINQLTDNPNNNQIKNKIISIESTDCDQIMEYALNQCIQNNKNRQKAEKKKEEILIICGSIYIMSNARKLLGFDDIIDPNIDFSISDIEFGKRPI